MRVNTGNLSYSQIMCVKCGIVSCFGRSQAEFSFKKFNLGEFPGGPVVRIQRFHYRGPGSIPGRGTKVLPQAAWQGQKKKNQFNSGPSWYLSSVKWVDNDNLYPLTKSCPFDVDKLIYQLEASKNSLWQIELNCQLCNTY